MAKFQRQSAGQKRPTQNDYARKVADTLIEQIKAGTAPWQKSWLPGEHHMPRNLVSGRDYHGGNAVYLWAVAMGCGYGDSRWLTYRQAKELGGQVRKGEHGTGIVYYAKDSKPARDAEGKPVLNSDGSPKLSWVGHAVGYTVFNACQVDGLPPQEVKREQPMWERHADAERIIRNSGARIEQFSSDNSYYDLPNDKIVLPLAEQFMTRDDYYATALHELGHWTGHGSRLDRHLEGVEFGSVAYAKEELRAEIASMMLGDELGIGNGGAKLMDQHAAYVENWVKVLADDPKEILRASSAATGIVSYIHEIGRDRSLDIYKEGVEKDHQADLQKSEQPQRKRRSRKLERGGIER